MLNKAQIIGRIGQDPEVRYAPSGDAVCNLSVATTEKWKDKATGEAKEETTWHRVTLWGKLAEIAGEYLRKGALVYFEGKMVQRKYQDREGVEKISHEIRAEEMKMLGSKQDGEQRAPAPAPAPAARRAPAPAPAIDDLESDIPF